MRYRWWTALFACFGAALLSELPDALVAIVDGAPLATASFGGEILRWTVWGAVFGPLVYRGAWTCAGRRLGLIALFLAAMPVMLLYAWSVWWLDSAVLGRSVQTVDLSLFQPMVVYTLTAGAGFHLRTEQRRAIAERLRLDAEARFATARLEILRSELQPHFLFNALNTVTSLTRRDPSAAAAVAEDLRDLFRATVGTVLPPVTSVAEEVRLTRKYLQVQQARFEHRLRTKFDIRQEVEEARIPALLLQPLVENAVRFGMTRREGITLTVTIERTGDELRVLVVNDGVADSRPVIEGVGLSNTRARLEALYGDAARFVARRVETGGFEVEARIPFESERA
jgi:hypothetical protein